MRSASVVLVSVLALAGCDGDPASGPVPTATSPAAPTSTTASEPAPPSRLQHGLLARLAGDPVVVNEMFGRAPRGVVLCGIDLLGHARGERYAWLFCGAYRTGPDAELLSGGADAVVIRRGGQVEFPRHDLPAEIDQAVPAGRRPRDPPPRRRAQANR